jgi:protein AaeX
LIRERLTSFVEVNSFGVYVAPISVMMVAAWLILAPLCWVADRSRILRRLWRPALLECAGYVMIFSSIVLLAAN